MGISKEKSQNPPSSAPTEEKLPDQVKGKDVKPIWVMKRNNMIRKTDPTTTSSKSKRHNVHHKNNFHMDLRNKWSQLVTNKISALAFQRALKDIDAAAENISSPRTKQMNKFDLGTIDFEQ